MSSTHNAVLVVLTYVEVVGDPDGFFDAWHPWIEETMRTSRGCLAAVAHREANGRRMLLIHHWSREADWERWSASEQATAHRALLDRHAARTAESQWRPERVSV